VGNPRSPFQQKKAEACANIGSVAELIARRDLLYFMRQKAHFRRVVTSGWAARILVGDGAPSPSQVPPKRPRSLAKVPPFTAGLLHIRRKQPRPIPPFKNNGQGRRGQGRGGEDLPVLCRTAFWTKAAVWRRTSFGPVVVLNFSTTQKQRCSPTRRPNRLLHVLWNSNTPQKKQSD
jgi:hypothetical protein